MASQLQRAQVAEWFRDLFESNGTKLVLSSLIIASVLPFRWVQVYGLAFFLMFAIELYGRFVVLRHDVERRRLSWLDVAFFSLDGLATLSYLPIEWLWDDIRLLRLFRLSRMLLLLGYWGPVVRQIWVILAKRERRYHLFFAAASTAILAFLFAILLNHPDSIAFDFNEDGVAADGFADRLWWSFRQIQDPGNLVKTVNSTLVFFSSLLLTVAGMFVFSFIIGIASSVVDELVTMGRERRLGLRGHSVICNLGPYSSVVLDELLTYYAKSLRSARLVTMGPAAFRYGYMHEGALTGIRYRQGRALNAHDLNKVDADRARRVILLGQRDRTASDAEVVSQILSVRQVNEECAIYAELFRSDNVAAALRAGGTRTVPIQAERLVGLLLAQMVSFPGLESIFGHLLSSQGNEIYTCIFGTGTLENEPPPSGVLPALSELLERGHRGHGVILLGRLLSDPQQQLGYVHELNPVGLLGGSSGDGSQLRGLVGIAPNFEQLKQLALSLPDVAVAASAAQVSPSVPLFVAGDAGTSVKQLLVCGFHDALAECCEQLILTNGAPQIRIVVAHAAQQLEVMGAFAHRPETDRARRSKRHVELEPVDGTRIDYQVIDVDGAACSGFIQVLVGDWSNLRTLRSGMGYFRLADIDVVLFTHTEGEGDPDARTSLALLKLLELQHGEPGALKASLRIVCEVLDGEKAALLQQRFGPLANGCHPVSVLSVEALRNALVAQSVFVPGIELIYRELLSDGGQQICKLVKADVDEHRDLRLCFSDVLMALYHRQGLIVLAVELRDSNGQHRVVVNPRRQDDDYFFQAEALVGVFVIANHSELPRAPQPRVDSVIDP